MARVFVESHRRTVRQPPLLFLWQERQENAPKSTDHALPPAGQVGWGCMTPLEFRSLVQAVTTSIADAPLDAALEKRLNQDYPPQAGTFRALQQACLDGIAGGWICTQGGGKRKFGRIFEPAPDLAGFSVDVVDLDDLTGSYHRHPNGEIDLIMPLTEGATFDARGAGWLVYRPGSGHRPTVKKGRLLVLYLLPQGRIEWTTKY
jgi:hypothetical protein